MGSTHYFDTSMYNYLVDDPTGKEAIEGLNAIEDDFIFISPINIEEICLTARDRRAKIISVLNMLKKKLVLLRHPEFIEFDEYMYAMSGGTYEKPCIFEKSRKAVSDFNELLTNTNYDISKEEKERIKLIRLRNRYVQVVTRKEPKGRHSFSDTEKARAEMMALSVDELKENIRKLGSTNFCNEAYTANDIVNGIRALLIEVTAKTRPNIRYFFDKDIGTKMLQLRWPNKEKDQLIADLIMTTDFKLTCPGAWVKMWVSFKQANYPINLGNWGDLAQSLFLPYIGYFWTADKTFQKILSSIDITGFKHCGSILYFQPLS